MAEANVEEIINDLILKVKDAPEAEQIAMKSLIEQMHQVAEQMKQTRELANFQKLQQTMIQHWIKLKELCKENPAMLERIETWKKQFIDNKKVMMELITGFKDQITDKTQELQEAWNNVYTDIGIMKGICGRFGITGLTAFTDFNVWIETEEAASGEFAARMKFETLKAFINACNALLTGHNLVDVGLPEFNVNTFLAKMNKSRSEIMQWAWNIQRIEKEDVVPIEKFPELKQKLEGLEGKLNNLSKIVKDMLKLFSQIKIIRDTKILEAY